MDNEKRWTNQELNAYISRFESGEAKDNIIKELITAKIIREVLDTPEGKLILDTTIDGIRDNMMKIIRYCLIGQNQPEVQKAALEINVAYDFIHGIAVKLSRGDEHEKKMGK